MKGKLNLAIEYDIPKDGFVPDNVLFANIDRIKKESHLDVNISDDNIRASVKYIQDLIVDRVTGSCLSNQLKLIVGNCLINENSFSWYKQLLDVYIFPIIIYGVKADLSIENTLKIRQQGVIRNNDTQHLQYPGLSDIKYLKTLQNEKLDLYINRAVEFLRCNKKHFCELCGCGCICNCEIAPYNRDYSLPFSLKPYPRKFHCRHWGGA